MKAFIARLRKSTVYGSQIEAAEILIAAIKISLTVLENEKKLYQEKTMEYRRQSQLPGIDAYKPNSSGYKLLFKHGYSGVYSSLLEEEGLAYAKLKKVLQDPCFEIFEKRIKEKHREDQAREDLLLALEGMVSSFKVEIQIQREIEGSDLNVVYSSVKNWLLRTGMSLLNMAKGIGRYIKELPPPQFYASVALIAFIYAPNFIDSLAKILNRS